MDTDAAQELISEHMDDTGAELPEEHMNQENVPAAGPTKKKRERKEANHLVRDLGKSLLPFSRVQKIIKADKEIPIIARDATFLISLAAEEFIKRLCQAGQKAAEKEKRTTVQHKDLASVVRRADEFMFLDEIISLDQPEPQKRIPKALATKPLAPATVGSTFLDTFVKTKPTNALEQLQETEDS
ncbi:histone-fold-containing protein [Lentinula raphanica]|nr:histone-fold-containing protein [Lentinula raphanica]